MKARQGTVLALPDNEAVVRQAGIPVVVTGIAIEVVGSNHDIRAVLDQQVVLVPHPECIPRQGNSPAILQMDVDLHIAEDISRYGNIPLANEIQVAAGQTAADDADIGRAGRWIVREVP